MQYDVFICHASEDKDDFVRPLAERLRENRIEVWYDEFSLKVGDSIRRAIDIGLAKSRYGIVVLSKSFINKEWPQWELDGLVQRQNTAKANIILPIWYGITKKEVIAFSASLADKKAVIASKDLNYVVLEILKVVKPEGSTLLIARDRLLEFGFEPPVVTDDWWLDVVEYSGSNDVEGTFQEAMGWGRWGFPLPPKGEKATEKGERLARTALQMLWQDKAERARISQITHPSEVLQFIAGEPGLALTCHEYLPYLATYAPQLTIKGFGGEFEEEFEAWYKQSLIKQRRKHLAHDISGTALTTNRRPPACDELLALRHRNFGYYRPEFVSVSFVQGDFMGPPVSVYEIIDYIVWFLSEQSSWIPKKIHQFILEGFRNWPAWEWVGGIGANNYGFAPNQLTGALFSAMLEAKKLSKFKLTQDCLVDIKTRFGYTADLFGLSETSDILADRFVMGGFIATWIKRRLSKTKY
jgi:hypothetical protein